MYETRTLRFMFGLGTTEFLVILLLALLVLGPERIPKVASQLGKAIRGFRRTTQDLKDQIDEEGEISRSLTDLHSALRGDPAVMLSAGMKNESFVKEKEEEAKPAPLILPPSQPPLIFELEEPETMVQQEHQVKRAETTETSLSETKKPEVVG